jgi:type II restriction enzyme
MPSLPKINYPKVDLHSVSQIYEDDINPIINTLTGWKKHVFCELNNFSEEVFSSQTVKIMAEQLHKIYPTNNNSEAKIRQILQYLRDLGLVEFTTPGIYKKLWNNQ